MRVRALHAAFAVLVLAAFTASRPPGTTAAAGSGEEDSMKDGHTSVATFAGGCFWCIEADFEKIDGVKEVVSGYTGGQSEDPTYKEVSTGLTGHLEAVRVHFDPSKVGYRDLLAVFWTHVDPTDPGGQFVDRGSQYRTAIFYHDEEQRELAEFSKEKLDGSGFFDSPIVTEIRKAEAFYPAEDYHQGYYKTCPVQYRMYRQGSGRDAFIMKIWGDGKADRKGKEVIGGDEGDWSRPGEQALKEGLSPMQYHVTQACGTEPPFDNAYWDNKREGIYVDIVSGEPLFSSTDKFDSGSGWPSFMRPIDKGRIVEKVDDSHGMVRTEVRSRGADSHLGHVFPDGPGPEGLRYCINSASLRFIPREDLEKEGYGQYLKLFE